MSGSNNEDKKFSVSNPFLPISNTLLTPFAPLGPLWYLKERDAQSKPRL